MDLVQGADVTFRPGLTYNGLDLSGQKALIGEVFNVTYRDGTTETVADALVYVVDGRTGARHYPYALVPVGPEDIRDGLV